MESMLINFTTKRSAAPSVSPVGKKPRIESAELFNGNSEVVIVHQNEEYNLPLPETEN